LRQAQFEYALTADVLLRHELEAARYFNFALGCVEGSVNLGN
jgi:hypothetical protein